MSSRSLPVSYVKVGTRYRKDLGDLSSLADSIRAIGLIHPIVVDKNHHLIAGQRRFEAWKLSKPDQPVPAIVIDTLDDAVLRLTAERDENTCRKDMVASELLALGKAIKKLEEPAARDRQRTAGKPLGKSLPKGKTAQKVGEALGVSGETWRRLEDLGDAARNGDAEAAAALERIDKGESSINKEYDRKRGAPKRDWSKKTEVLPDTIGNVRTLTRKKPATHILERAVEQLDGVASMLETLDMSEVKPAEAERLAASLSRSRSVLSRTINSLRSIA